MTNLEHYKDRIYKIMTDLGYQEMTCAAKVVKTNSDICGGIDCNDCARKTLDWLAEEYKDPAAIAALTAYAKVTDNQQLTVDILDWIKTDDRVLVLPCKVGDTVWSTLRKGVPVIERLTVARIYCRVKGGSWQYVLKSGMLSPKRPNEFEERTISAASFGKTVFLTHEKAEAALKAREGAEAHEI